MTPVQMLRVGLGDEAVNIPLFRLPYVGGADGVSRPGGLFTTRDGEFGIVLDANTGLEDAQRILADEIRDHGQFLAAALQNAIERNKKPGREKDTDNRDSETNETVAH